MDNEIYMEAIESVNKKLDRFSEQGSGWKLEKIKGIHLTLARYKLIRGGNSFADTPKDLRNKKAIVNVKNKDNLCFLWSVLAKLHPAEDNPQRVTHYKKYLKTLKLSLIHISEPTRRS